jgi:uncharacterized RDD family membrane protein YckC
MSDALPPEPAPAPAAPAAATATPVAATAALPADFVYADVPNRAIAYIIDAILIGIIGFIVQGILGTVGIVPATIDSDLTITINPVAALIVAVVNLVIGAVYFIYLWTKRRATIGMSALSMQVGNAGDGATLTTEQAIRRWLAISAPGIIAQALLPLGTIGWVAALMAFAWFIFLVYTTASSPTKQGWHDVFANTMVVKAAKRVG